MASLITMSYSTTVSDYRVSALKLDKRITFFYNIKSAWSIDISKRQLANPDNNTKALDKHINYKFTATPILQCKHIREERSETIYHY